jgi:hypothetical protein
MDPEMHDEPWRQPLFAETVSTEIILSLARAFTGEPVEDSDAQGALDRIILGMLGVELFKRGTDYRVVPWVIRLEHVRLTGQGEGQRPDRPASP